MILPLGVTGAFTNELIATDSDGNERTSDPIVLTVNPVACLTDGVIGRPNDASVSTYEFG